MTDARKQALADYYALLAKNKALLLIREALGYEVSNPKEIEEMFDEILELGITEDQLCKLFHDEY